MKHIRVTNDTNANNFSITEVFGEDFLEPKNVIGMFNLIAELVNCRNVEITNQFFFQLTEVTNECRYYYQMNSYENTVKCVVLLQNILNYSQKLFENL